MSEEKSPKLKPILLPDKKTAEEFITKMEDISKELYKLMQDLCRVLYKLNQIIAKA